MSNEFVASPEPRFVEIEITHLQYNEGAIETVDANRFHTTLNKSNLRQRLHLGEDIAGTARYQFKKDRTKVKFSGSDGGEGGTYDGLVQFELITDEGRLTYGLE